MRHEWTVFPNGPDGHAHLLFVTTLEKTGEPASNATPAEAFAEILRLAKRVCQHEAHEAGIRQTLRIECEELGDNDWPDDLHLGDVIEKHLCQPVAAKIATLEAEVEAALRGQVEISESNGRMLDKLQERERKLREALAETTAALENFRFAPAFAHEPVILRSRALLKEEA